MLKFGDKVRLTTGEKSGVETFVGEPIAPTSKVEVAAWLELAAFNLSEASPEEKLMAAVFGDMRAELAA